MASISDIKHSRESISAKIASLKQQVKDRAIESLKSRCQFVPIGQVADIRIVNCDCANSQRMFGTFYIITSHTTEYTDQHWQKCFELFADHESQDLMTAFNSVVVSSTPDGGQAHQDLTNIIKNIVGILHILDGCSDMHREAYDSLLEDF